jgi:hypothetical protein
MQFVNHNLTVFALPQRLSADAIRNPLRADLTSYKHVILLVE